MEFDANRFRVKYCPCNKSNKDGKFSPFEGCDEHGHCHSCGKTFFPDLSKDEGFRFPVSFTPRGSRKRETGNFETSYVPKRYLDASMAIFGDNHFFRFLVDLVGEKSAEGLVQKYWIGSSKQKPGHSVFWQVDYEGKIRTGKIIEYDPLTGKRIKGNCPDVSWVHSNLSMQNFQLQQCFFGEHLLPQSDAMVAIVESEKTAVIASHFCPQFVWLATGGKQNLSPSKLTRMTSKEVILFPDNGAYHDWLTLSERLSRGLRLKVSDCLEKIDNCYAFEPGFDIADFLIQESRVSN